MKTYYKNQQELSQALCRIIDDYWGLKKSEETLSEELRLLAEENEELMFEEGQIRGLTKRRLGKRRLILLERILKGKKGVQ